MSVDNERRIEKRSDSSDDDITKMRGDEVCALNEDEVENTEVRNIEKGRNDIATRRANGSRERWKHERES